MFAVLATAALLLVPQDPAPAAPRDTTPRRKRPAVGDTLRPRDFEEVTARDTTRVRRADRAPKRVPTTDALRQSAFADPLARELLEKARVARLRNDASIRAYDAMSYQRMSAGLGFKVLGKERLAFRAENSAHVRWSRDVGVHLEMTGARVAFPIIGGLGGKEAEKEAQGGGMSDITPIPWYPGKDALWIGGGLARAQVNEREIVHPLASGSEAYYRYATGDSLSLTISKDRTIRLRELRITAREPRWNLIVGSFWFDVGTGQLVRAAYRFSVAMDPIAVAREVGDSSDKKDIDEIPMLAKPLIFPMQVDVQSISVEYGLFNGAWMPRSAAMEAFARVSFMRVPVRMEERYRYNSVNATDEPPLPVITVAKRHSTFESGNFGDFEDDEGADSVRTTTVGIGIGADGAKGTAATGTAPRARTQRDSIRQAVRDSIAAARLPAARTDSARRSRAERRAERDSARAREIRAECAANNGFRTKTELRYGGTLPVAIRVPCDTAVLVHSKDLPPSIYDAGEELFGSSDRDELIKSLDLGLQAGFGPQRPEWQFALADGAWRYNRVEGLSTGGGVRQVLGGGYAWHAEARYNTGENTLLAEAGIERANGRRTLDLTLYRRTAVAGDWGSPLGFGPSIAALLYGRDEGFYFRSAGAELTWTTGAKRDVEVRLFGEQQDNLPRITQFSVFGGNNDPGFTPNLVARAGRVAGLSTRVRRFWGENPRGWRGWGDGRAELGGGDWAWQRGAVDLGVSHPIAGPLELAVQVGGGAAFGDVPQQRLFYLGGLHTIRGLAPGTAADRGGIVGTPGGTAYWLSRTELGWGGTGYRLIGFYDAGWTGRKAEWLRPGIPMQGAGVGVSMLDGLLRFDIARGLTPTQQWRVDFSVDAKF